MFVRDRQPAAAAAIGTYAKAVLADGPAGYWRFGESGGTALFDASPNANNGTYVGGVDLGVPGALQRDPDSAAALDGSDSLAVVPDAASLDVGDTFTIEGWIRRSSSATITLFDKGTRGPQLTVNGDDDEVWLRKAGVGAIARSDRGVPADGSYHHVVATKEGVTTKIYVDGREQTVQLAPEHVVQNTGAALRLGPAQLRTDLDEFALYDRALHRRDVFEHYALGARSRGEHARYRRGP